MKRKVLAISLLAISLVWIIAGCNEKNSEETTPATPTTSQEPIIALEESGAIPKLERENTLTGVDANANGVRDDIDAFINNKYSSNAQRAAVIQTAKAMQNALTSDTTNIQDIKAIAQEISYGINCIYLQFDGAEGTTPPAQVVHELKSITSNTKQRLLAYLEFNKALDGTSSALPKGDTCE
ncbi:MAG: hypothetical protein LBE32_02905 [Burkholderiales bacterium]|jgi:hypothetical protein|nr:hypothetical protein [Burkholderiales bacterium]